jgi:DNA-binding MarR family transcriptional regulator
VVNLDQYPEKTEQILVALLEYEEREREDEDSMMKRRLLASQTELNKQQVRYRLGKLVDDGLVARDEFTEGNQRITYYGLRPQGRVNAKGAREIKDVLGEVPDPVDREDVWNLSIELAAIRAELEAERMDVGSSIFTDKLNELQRRIKQIENELGIDY